MAEFLLELLSEEIPARMQARAADDLRRLATERLKAAALDFKHAHTYATPRRLTLVVDDLPLRQPDVRVEKKGPRVGSPDPAIQGFLKSVGLPSLDLCEKRLIGNGEFWFASLVRKGHGTAEVLAEIVAGALADLPWPKSMRWGRNSFRWVRPLQSVLAIFDGKALAGAIRLGDDEIPFADRSRGHRFLAPEAFAVASFADYRAKLKKAHVLLDPAERRSEIEKQAKKCAAEAGLGVFDDPALLDEVAGLVEWPHVLIGGIDDLFMHLPAEVLTTAMRRHQKYFALTGAGGALAGRFLVVSNMKTTDGGAAIVAGNERVLRARLSDARFFWDQDCKHRLADRVPALAKVTFHEKLGSIAAKVARIAPLASDIANALNGAHAGLAIDLEHVRIAATLAKADLVTGMVGEFPELQGIMGRYYALHDKEWPEVADAVREHYKPLGPQDACPKAPISVAVALADKIDTLVGFFLIGEKPTGSKDPYALRRAALGVIRLIVENGLRLPLRSIFRQAERLYRDQLGPDWNPCDADVLAELLEFFADRLKAALKDRGVRHDLIGAVFALHDEDDLIRLLARVDALDAFLGTDDGANLLTAYRRAANIVRIEEKKDKTHHDGAVDPAALRESAELALAETLNRVRKPAETALAREDFNGAMATLAVLRRPVDEFFDSVTVNCQDAGLRLNRLRLLRAIGVTLNTVADFSQIEG